MPGTDTQHDEVRQVMNEEQYKELLATVQAAVASGDSKTMLQLAGISGNSAELHGDGIPSYRKAIHGDPDGLTTVKGTAGYKSWADHGMGEFYMDVRYAGGGNPDAIAALARKALNEGSVETGGALVPDEFRAELLRLALEDAIIRPRARVIPMASSTMKLPRIAETSRASSVYGGIIAYWTEEAGSKTASEPDFGQFTMTAKKLIGYTQASDELLADSAIALEALLNTLFSDAIRFYEEDSFINGTGAGQPLGILNSGALISVAKETGQAATTILTENLVKMYSRMLPRSQSRGIWVANPNCLPQLLTLSLSVGTGGSVVWMGANGGATTAPPTNILGRPVFYTEHAQTLGTVGDIYFIDPAYYVIGDRQALTVASSPHVRFQNDETVWRFVERLDGAPWVDSALTPQNGSTLSPFIALATRS